MMGLTSRLPDGCSVHIVGPGPEGWRVVAVWSSLEKAQQFATTILQPVQAELGVASPTKRPVIWKLYNTEVEPPPTAAYSSAGGVEINK
jgi:hypothetical protein